jgi:hypothetical protein
MGLANSAQVLAPSLWTTRAGMVVNPKGYPQCFLEDAHFRSREAAEGALALLLPELGRVLLKSPECGATWVNDQIVRLAFSRFSLALGFWIIAHSFVSFSQP